MGSRSELFGWDYNNIICRYVRIIYSPTLNLSLFYNACVPKALFPISFYVVYFSASLSTGEGGENKGREEQERGLSGNDKNPGSLSVPLEKQSHNS